MSPLDGKKEAHLLHLSYVLTLSSLGVCKRSRVRSDVKIFELPWASKYSSTMLGWLGSEEFLLFLAGVL